jgi:Zn-dependent M28 family amino/carboxypeptidase
LMESGPAKVHLRLGTEMRSGLRDSSVWGVLPGTTDEDIIVMSHHDSVFTGALDNASGMSVMVGLAEYFSKIPKEQRRRTIKFVTTAGHHAGSFGTLWMHDNRSTFLAKTAVMINCEHVSPTQTYYFGPALRASDNVDARRWYVNGSTALAALALNAYKSFGVTIYDRMEPSASGDMGHVDRDAPAVQLIESPVWYHTDHDTPDVVPAAGLEAAARAYAKIIDQVNKLDRRQLLPESSVGTSTNPKQ